MGSSPSPVSSLPRFMGLKGENNKYLVLTPNGLLSFDSEKMSRLTTHEVLYNSDDDTFVIRSQNSRFWSRNSQGWIYATLENPPAASDRDNRFKLVQIREGVWSFVSAKDGRYLKRYDSLVRGYNALLTDPDLFSEVNVSSAEEYAVTIPRYVAFKGDNGKYMFFHHEKNLKWLKFKGDEPDDGLGTNEVIPLLDGNVAMWHPGAGGCWRNGRNWVFADAEKSTALKSRECHFEPIKLGPLKLALKCVSNDRFVRRLTTDGWVSCLNASGTDSVADIYSHLQPEDALRSRHVFNVTYLLNLASTSDLRVLTVAHGSMLNNSNSLTDLNVGLTLTQQVSQSRSWSNAFTFKQSIKTEFKTGLPVLNPKFEIEVGFEQSFSNEWGVTTTEGIEFQTSVLVKDVLPGEKVTVELIASTAKMRIPFTYRSRETDLNGVEKPITEGIDGIFEGINAYKTEAVVTNSKGTYRVPLAMSKSGLVFGENKVR